MRGYGQFCPIAKASEVLAERWTPLVLRELLCGSHSFNDLLRGVPLMSRTLLSKRLKELEQAGVVERQAVPGKHHSTYHLTEAGEELRPIIMSLGDWGQRWARSRYTREDLDPRLLMWDIHRSVDLERVPEGRTVVQFSFPDVPRKELRRSWLVFDPPEVEVCYKDPGFVVDLMATVPLRTLTMIWMGDAPFDGATDLELQGPRQLVRDFPCWLKLSAFAGTPSAR
jgi:DNA-binding HxlR family transcriptional regulator